MLLLNVLLDMVKTGRPQMANVALNKLPWFGSPLLRGDGSGPTPHFRRAQIPSGAVSSRGRLAFCVTLVISIFVTNILNVLSCWFGGLIGDHFDQLKSF